MKWVGAFSCYRLRRIKIHQGFITIYHSVRPAVRQSACLPGELILNSFKNFQLLFAYHVYFGNLEKINFHIWFVSISLYLIACLSELRMESYRKFVLERNICISKTKILVFLAIKLWFEKFKKIKINRINWNSAHKFVYINYIPPSFLFRYIVDQSINAQ